MIKGAPTPGLSYDPNESRYWDPDAVRQELERAFEICNLCRLCFNLCPSFPALFEALDRCGGNVRSLSEAEVERVIALCYQCKLCYVKCPYTPDDKHEFQLDFPRLLLRAVAVRARQRGRGLREWLLARPDLLGRVGSGTAPLSNWANRQPWLRRGLEALIGIHRDKKLPEFQRETFEEWWRRRTPAAGGAGQAVLYVSCSVNFNAPAVGKACIEVLERNGIAVRCQPYRCCGMPALEAGDVARAQELARENVKALLPEVREGSRIVVLDPTCAYMLRKEYPLLTGMPEALEVAGATRDACEYLFELKQQGRLNRDFRSTPGRVAYHLPCHLRAQNIGYRSRDMLRLIPGTTVRLVEHCSGHDGTWAMKKEFFPLAMLAGRKAFEAMQNAEAEIWASDCPLAGLHIQQATGRRPLHPVEVLARAYRPDGFPQPVEDAKT